MLVDPRLSFSGSSLVMASFDSLDFSDDGDFTSLAAASLFEVPINSMRIIL